MTPEALEALLLDRAMGELSPEVAELLETHLSAHPEAARQAGALAAAMEMARRATAVVREAPRRPLGVERLRRIQVTGRQWAAAWAFARLAACVALGLALGWYGHALRPAPPTAVASATPAWDEPALENAGGFWSRSSLIAAQRERLSAERSPTVRYRLRWDSPVKMPQVEEDL